MFENLPETIDSIDLYDTSIQLREGGVAEPTERRGGALAGHDAGLWTIGAFHADSDQAVQPAEPLSITPRADTEHRKVRA